MHIKLQLMNIYSQKENLSNILVILYRIKTSAESMIKHGTRLLETKKKLKEMKDFRRKHERVWIKLRKMGGKPVIWKNKKYNPKI